RDDAERQVDVEDPSPREMRREVTADERPGYAGESEDCSKNSLISSAVPRRNDITDDCLRGDHESAAAESLHCAEHDQLRKALRKPAQRRADKKDDDGNLHDFLASVEVAELSVQRS